MQLSLGRRCSSRCFVLLALCVLASVAHGAASETPPTPNTQAAAAAVTAEEPQPDAMVEISAVEPTLASRPAIIGADGPELTQVDMAQRLGLSGKDITVCVIDTGVDVRNPTFGRDCPDGPQCRIAFGFDVETQGDDPTPSDWENAGGHGTHVSGIAVGGFPHKLKDDEGNLLPYQRGVAYGAKLGAIRASTQSSEFPYEYTRQALEKTIAKKCDVDNMSLGGFYVTPSKQLTPTIAKITEAEIIVTAAQGNDDQASQTGARIFNVASPGAFDEVFSIGHVNNTANPGSVLQLDKAVATASGKRNKIVANQRADTQASLCSNANCDGLNLPREILLIKMVPRDGSEEGGDPRNVACDMETVTKTKNSHAKGHVILLHIPKVCKAYQNSQEIWDLLQTLKPVLVLISLPSEEDSHVGPLYYRNKQTPVLWLREEDGHGLVAAMTAAPTSPIKLVAIPGAELVAVKDEYAGQPAITSALGPGYDLTMKPDISAPGSLYSSLPNSTYQTWPGTSMAAPYMAGVIALWKESVKRQGIKRPKEGWIQAAHIALKNTARPVPYKGSNKLMWPPVKVGAGVVQAYNAVTNKVRITPTQLLVRTDVASQKFNLSIHNTGDRDITYKLSHKAGVTVNLPKTWYGDGMDDKMPVAQVAVVKKQITVPANSNIRIEVKVTVPKALQEVDGIFGGFIMFTPLTTTAASITSSSSTSSMSTSSSTASSHNKKRSSSSSSAHAFGLAAQDEPVPLTVPYQGSSKDYSTFDREDKSLVLFVPPLYDHDPSSSEALESKPSLFLCDAEGAGKCGFSEKSTLRAAMSVYSKGYRFASTLLRPVADVKVQVWSSDGKTHLGTSASQGPGGTAPPLRRTYLTANSWDGTYIPTSNSNKDGSGTAELKTGKTYTLKLELYPVLAAADRMAGRQLKAEPLVYELDTKLQVVDDSQPFVGGGGGGSGSKASTKSKRSHGSSGSSSSSSSSGGSSKGHTSSKSSRSSSSSSSGSSHSGNMHTKHARTQSVVSSVQRMRVVPKHYIALPL